MIMEFDIRVFCCMHLFIGVCEGATRVEDTSMHIQLEKPKGQE